MQWEAIGAIAEALGAVAVIVSIMYLAVQVRQTRVQLQAQAEDAITARSFDAYSPVYEGNNASIFRRGLKCPQELSEDEAFVFRLLMDRQRGAFATIVRRARAGSISKELAKRLLAAYRYLFLRTEGGKLWLSEAKDTMSHPELKELEEG